MTAIQFNPDHRATTVWYFDGLAAGRKRAIVLVA